MESLLCLLVKTSLSLEPRTVVQQSIKSWNQEVNCPRGSRGVMMRVRIPFPLLDTWVHQSWLSEKKKHILAADSEHTQPSRKPTQPQPYKRLKTLGTCYLVHTRTASSKVHATALQRNLFQIDEEHDKTSGFHEHEHIATPLCL